MDSLYEAMDAEASGIPPLGDIDRAIHDVSVARRRWAGVVGVAAAVLVLLVALVGPTWQPLTMESAVNGEPSTSDAPDTVTGYFTGSNPLVTFTYVLPDGWVPEGDPGFLVGAENAVLHFWDVGNVYADGCQGTLLDPPLGPTVDDLANVWAELPGFTATTPVDITIDGYAGKLVEYTVPDYEEADCHNGKFAMWTDDHGSQLSPGFWAQVPEQQNRQWILDIDGTRLVITEWSDPGTTAEQLSEMDQFLASIQIG